jgi:hypothetical protein
MSVEAGTTSFAPQRDRLPELIQRWRSDRGGTYQTWFLWEDLRSVKAIARILA